MSLGAIRLWALAAALAAAQAAPTVRQLAATFIETVENAGKARALGTLAQTRPANLRDLESLYDLFMRFPDDNVRGPVLSSLQLLAPGTPDAEPMALRLLADDDDNSVMFGIKMAERLRSTGAAPVLRKLGEKKFKHSSALKAQTTAERNAWAVEFEALAALAQLEGPKALALLKRRAGEAPDVARLMAEHLWAESLPVVAGWASGGAADKARASAALSASVPVAALRPTRERMLAVVRDPSADRELRHQLAIKVGLCSTPPEVAGLLKAYEAASDPYDKRLYAAAAFASRDDQIVPLLTRFAKEDPDANTRLVARLQLKDMLKPAEYRAVLEWAAKSDPDADNRDLAQKELRAP